MDNLVVAEIKKLGTLSAPIVVTQLSQMGFGVVDAIMAGRISAVDLAGVGLGNNVYWPLMLFISGVLMSVTPTVSQLDGAGRRPETGEVARQALWLAAFGAVLGVYVLHNATPLYEFVQVDARAVPLAASYLHALSFGFPAVLGYFTLRYLCEGLSWTKPAMLVALSALTLKILLNTVFVNGAFGFEGLGGVGCGWATAAAMWYQLTVMIAVVALSHIRRSGVFSRFQWPSLHWMRRLIVLGLPIGLMMFVEVGFFSSVSLSIGRLGVDALASHQIAMNVGGIGFMIPLALSIASTIRVGFNVGAGDLAAARRSAGVAVGASLAVGSCMGLVLLTARGSIAALYITDAAVLATTTGLLLLCALYQVFDAGQATAIGALRGYKDTQRPMLIALVAYWGLGLPTGWGLTFGWFGAEGLGVFGFWWGLVLGLAVAALVLLERLRRVSRQ